jgi:diphthine synthase
MTKGKISFVGLGLYDEKDISLKGIEEIKNCDIVYAEFYTAILAGTDLKKIEKTIKKKIEVLSREETEKGSKILESAETKNVVFLTCGDPMSATTHVDLRLSALKAGIKTKIVHGSSIFTAVPGLLGLQNYKFGRTTTIAYPEKDYFPTSPYSVINYNKKLGLHTLVLLDIQAEKNRFMTANEAIKLLLDMEEKMKENVIKQDTILCVIARAGSDEPVVEAGFIKDLIDKDFGPPLHTIVVPGKLHFMEFGALRVLAHLPA